MSSQIIPQLLNIFSIGGVIVFAVSGALIAAEKKMDILGFILIGTVTGIGGGTLRDLLLGISPVSWVQEPLLAYLCIAASAVTYFSFKLIKDRSAWILWMDAIGLSAFAIMGAETALAHHAAPVIAIIMGVMSATFGGVMRDVLCAQSLILMQPEIYITCALVGSSVYVALSFMEVGNSVCQLAGFISALSLRSAAIVYKLTLPRFDS